MRGNALLDALTALARERGLTVRREALTRGVTSGGVCVLKGVPTVFIDDRAKADAQIDALSSVLRRFDWSQIELPPAVQALLVKTAPAGSATAHDPSTPPAPRTFMPSVLPQ